MTDIVLNEHQIYPTYKLIEKCKNQHGLVLYYGMGTGKTLAALTFILQFPGKDIIIICPEDLKFIWENEIGRLPIKNNIKILFYEKPDAIISANYKNKILVMDEGHHIVNTLASRKGEMAKIMKNIFSSFKTLVLTGTPIYTGLVDLTFLVNIAAGKDIVPYNYSKFNQEYYKIIKHRSVVFGHFLPIMKILSSVIINMLSLVAIGGLGYSTYIEFQSKEKQAEARDILFDNLQGAKATRNLRIANTTTKITLPVLGITLIFIILLSILNYKIQEDYKKFDTEKFINNTGPYISYYKNTTSIKDSPFPTFTSITKLVPYSDYQTGLCIRLTQGVMGVDDVSKLNIGSEEDLEYYSKKIDMDTYVKNGVLIGNLSENDSMYSPKFDEILKTAYGKRAVFYSGSLGSGTLLFKRYLKSKDIDCLYLDIGITTQAKNKILQDFKNKTIFLLLHPRYTEGISILGAEQIHLLEPIPVLAKKEQVIARVIRYLSHAHLPEKERHVQVYQWGCECTTLLSKIRKKFVSVSSWAKFNPEVFYNQKFNIFDQDITPDSIVLKKEITNIGDIKGITDLLVEREKKQTKRDCCIKLPSKKQDSGCRKTFKKNCGELENSSSSKKLKK